jgi:hypothetical protein
MATTFSCDSNRWPIGSLTPTASRPVHARTLAEPRETNSQRPLAVSGHVRAAASVREAATPRGPVKRTNAVMSQSGWVIETQGARVQNLGPIAAVDVQEEDMPSRRGEGFRLGYRSGPVPDVFDVRLMVKILLALSGYRSHRMNREGLVRPQNQDVAELRWNAFGHGRCPTGALALSMPQRDAKPLSPAGTMSMHVNAGAGSAGDKNSHLRKPRQKPSSGIVSHLTTQRLARRTIGVGQHRPDLPAQGSCHGSRQPQAPSKRVRERELTGVRTPDIPRAAMPGALNANANDSTPSASVSRDCEPSHRTRDIPPPASGQPAPTVVHRIQAASPESRGSGPADP